MSLIRDRLTHFTLEELAGLSVLIAHDPPEPIAMSADRSGGAYIIVFSQKEVHEVNDYFRAVFGPVTCEEAMRLVASYRDQKSFTGLRIHDLAHQVEADHG